MTTIQEIFAAAQSLPPNERARLIEQLWGTLSADQWPLPSEGWIAEAQRRSEALDAGEMSSSSWAEVRKRVRRQAGLDD